MSGYLVTAAPATHITPYTISKTDGIYTVQLVAFNNCGSDTSSMVVEVITLPQADFSLDNNTGCVPFIVEPTNSSSANTDDWLWLADGATPATSTSPNPSFTYENEGNFTLILIASNEAGSDTTELDITINDLPEASFETQQKWFGCNFHQQ